MFNTLLFDLDGTLVDTAPDLAAALNTLLAEYQRPPKPYAQIKPLVAFGSAALIQFGFESDQLSESDFVRKQQRFLSLYASNIATHSALFAGMNAVLAQLKARSMFWGIVTNKPTRLTHLLLNALNLSPDVVVCGDTLAHSKPHPAPLLFACAQLAISNTQCLFVGDDENDIIAGKRAQIKTAAAHYGYGITPERWQADFSIACPKDLLPLLSTV